MFKLESTQPVPLTQWEDGSIRIIDSRVTLDSIVHHFKLGACAEEIVYKFPSLRLIEVYGAITYYLNHQEEVEEYLRQRDVEAEETRRLIESSPFYKDKNGLRERLLARRAELQRGKPATDQE
jgi:uncharacterized protein (DUF433 family)